MNNMWFNCCRGGVQVSIQRKKTVEISLDGLKKNYGKEKKIMKWKKNLLGWKKIKKKYSEDNKKNYHEKNIKKMKKYEKIKILRDEKNL